MSSPASRKERRRPEAGKHRAVGVRGELVAERVQRRSNDEVGFVALLESGRQQDLPVPLLLHAHRDLLASGALTGCRAANVDCLGD